jgi:cytochrome c biogenesis protein CcmG, thiol:disulfide interchange protein DsbE
VTATTPVQPKARPKLGRILEFVLYVVLAMVVIRWLSPSSSGPKAGTLAPSFELPVIAGGTGKLKLEDLRGSPAIIEVFASWCGACRDMAPTLSQVSSTPRERPIRIVGISVDDDAADGARSHRRDKLAFPVVHADAAFSKAYGITVLPTIIVIDEQGKIRHTTTGATRERTLESWLTELGAKKRE